MQPTTLLRKRALNEKNINGKNTIVFLNIIKDNEKPFNNGDPLGE